MIVGLKLIVSRAIHVSAVAAKPSASLSRRASGDQIAQISVGALTPGGSGLHAPTVVAISAAMRIRRVIARKLQQLRSGADSADAAESGMRLKQFLRAALANGFFVVAAAAPLGVTGARAGAQPSSTPSRSRLERPDLI